MKVNRTWGHWTKGWGPDKSNRSDNDKTKKDKKNPLNATAKKTKFNTKSITYSQSTSKIMVRSRWTVFEILLISAWNFMEECLTISLSTEWLKMY